MNNFNKTTLLITGGTGSFGHAVLRHFLHTDIDQIRIFSRDEKKQDEMRHELQVHHPDVADKVKFYIGDVRNFQSVHDAMVGVDYIFHAAALKQVPSCEFFPMEAVHTNVEGTDNVLHAAIEEGVKKVVCLSTDKAAYPINAMGTSKAMMEHVVRANARVAEERGGTVICCTRYGNVMCSRGSVIPLFIEQIKNGDPTSILFGAEKTGAIQLIDSVNEHLTEDSALLTGDRGRSVKLKKHITGVVNAFRKPREREKLPSSINGLWKADLFVGKTEPDKWVGTTVKINPLQLEAAKGLRLAIVPSKQGKSDKIYKHETKNLIVCPLPYDQSFMEVFLQGWRVIKYFLNSDAKMPKEINLPRSAERFVCKDLEDRRNFPVVGVIEAFEIVKQPDLLTVDQSKVSLLTTMEETHIKQIIAPMSVK